MNKSEAIDQLATALSKAQAEFETAKKTEKNPYYNSKYADIASLLDVIQGPMGKHGLSVIQLPTTDINSQTVTVETILCHSSGQWVSECYTVPATSPAGKNEEGIGKIKFDAQTIGKATTYARRYSLQAFLCLAAEDDDGNSISQLRNPQFIGSAVEAPPQAAETKVVEMKRSRKSKSSLSEQQATEPINLPDKSTLEITNDDLPFLPFTAKLLEEDREPTAAEKKSFADELLLYAEKVDRGNLREFFLNSAKITDPRELTYNHWIEGFNLLATAGGDVEKLKEIVKGKEVNV